jgi:hypothetical protein
VNGTFATTIDLSLLEHNLASAILADGQMWSRAQNQQLLANLQERNQYLKEKALLLGVNSAAQEAQNVQAQIAPLNTSITMPNGARDQLAINQATASCGTQVQRKDALGQGLIANAALAGNLGAALANYDVSNTSNQKTLQGLASAPPQSLSASSIFPTAASTSVAYPTAQAAAAAIAHMTNPTPPAQLTSIQAKTPAGKRWMAAQNIINAKMSMAQNALAQIAAWHQPTISASTFVQQWDNMVQNSQQQGSAAAPPAAPGVNAQGQISPDGALNLAIDARYANPKWYAQLAVQNTSGILKDINEMGSIGLRVHYEDMVTSTYMAGVSAEEYAHMSVSPAIRQMNQAAGSAMEQRANQPAGAAP